MDPSVLTIDADLRRAYRLDRAGLLARRIPSATAYFLVSICIAAVLDWIGHPERRGILTIVFVSQTAVGVATIALCGWRLLRPWVEWIAASFAIVLALLATVYLVAIDAPLEQLTVTHVCLLAGASVLLPWTWRAQSAMFVCSAISFALMAPALQSSVDLLTLGLPVVVIGVLTVSASYHLDDYRLAAFVEGSKHAEDARTTAALARVGDTLHAHLDDPEMLEKLSSLATEQLGCDWSATYLSDALSGVFQLRSLSGPVDAANRARLASYEFDRARLPLLELMDDQDLVEVPDASKEPLIPPALVKEFQLASALYTPIRSRTGVTGVLVHGCLHRVGPFTSVQRRLAIGIAHVAAIAIENARLIDELAAASRLKSEFVATMSHELRTPLNVITGYVDLLEDGVFGEIPSGQRDTLHRIRQSAFTLLELVSMTLDLGRLENGREPVTIAPVDLPTLIDELKIEQATLVSSGVSLAWRVPDGLVVRTDRTKVKTILKNLVGNALKFTTRGRVEVTLMWEDGRLHMTVADTGVGIEQADLAVIFEVFRQGDGSSTRRFEGVGLGLHIVKRFAEILGGGVSVESTMGEGSTFVATVPAELAAVLATA